ncbi:MAG: hypothetical protein V4692_11055 [Bdellovibrionota bacterium]
MALNEIWINAAESGLVELVEIERRILVDGVGEKSDLLFYVRLLTVYFRNDKTALTHFIAKNSDYLATHPELSLLAQIRLMVIEGIDDVDQLAVVTDRRREIQMSDFFKAETAYVLGIYTHDIKDFDAAQAYFLEAGALFDKIGAKKKSLRAHISRVAAYSCFRPESRLFAEYMDIYNRATKIDDHLSAGMALHNISNEFRTLRAHEIALGYIRQAIAVVSEKGFGSREHGLCLVHRAHLLLELNRSQEAEKDIFFALTISHAEVQSACRILGEKFGMDFNTLPSMRTMFTWNERKESETNTTQLGPLESRLVQILSEGAKTKFEIMESIYGDRIDSEARENRFKSLLSRFRSRFPGIIVLENDRYVLTDHAAQELAEILKRTARVG